MAGKSPGKKKRQPAEKGDGGGGGGKDDDRVSVHSAGGGAASLSRGASNLAQKVGSLFGGGSGRDSKRGKKGEKHKASSAATSSGGESGTRVEVAYHGKRTDARDRSSEDPRRHHIPRASVTPTKSRSPVPFDEATTATDQPPAVRPRVKLRKKSLEKEMERRASRERELEREKRLRDRSRSRERLADLSSSEQVRTTSSTSQQQSTTSSSSKTRIIQTTVSKSSYQQLQQKSLARSSSSVTSSRRESATSAEGGSPTRRQASFRVERNVQLSRSDLGMPPPIPPPRARTPKSSYTETSFDVTDNSGPASTSTPKKTPFQFWREQRLAKETSPASTHSTTSHRSSDNSLMHSSSTSTVINTFLQQSDTVQDEPQQQQQQRTSTTVTTSSTQHTTSMSSTGAVRKQHYAVEKASTQASSTPINVAMHAATSSDSRPPEKAEDILARWKRERAKRERHASGTSAASSTTAEPVRKVAHQTLPSQQVPMSVEIESGKKERKSSALSSMFQSFTRRKGKEPGEERKYSTIAALMKSAAPLDPVFHDNVLHPMEEGEGSPNVTIIPETEKEPVHGTVLHPLPPRPPSSSRTPFEEWRHYRGRPSDASEDSRQKRLSAPPIKSYSPLPSPALAAIRAKTPDPDYDSTSIGSASSRSSYGGGHRREGLHHQVGPQFYGTSPSTGQRSNSVVGIPRYVRPATYGPRPPSTIMSASPRLEHPPNMRTPSSDSFFGRHGVKLASAESQMWYDKYSHEAFPHEAVFDQDSAAFGVHNFDVRINSIKGRKNEEVNLHRV